MKKSSLKNYIAFLEADAIANASDYWMRQHELKDKELLEADNEIAELRRHFSDCTEHNHSFERDHNDTQA